MHGEPDLKELQKRGHGSPATYAAGFAASLILTSLSFLMVIFRWVEGSRLVYGLVLLALIQAAVQLRLFLHVGEEPKPRWESLVFYFMLLILFILAGGSLWIMSDLNDRVMKGM